MPVDYSKWKNIDVSDDEDDTHPNVDTPSLFRWRHQARIEKEAEKKKEKEEIEEHKTDIHRKIADVTKRLADSTIDEETKTKLQSELEEFKRQEEEWLKKEAEFAHKLELEPWNVDTIGHEAWSKSRINKISDKKPEPKLSADEENKLMMKFFNTHSKEIEKYEKLRGFDESHKFLMDHPHLCSEWTGNYLTIDALNAGIEDKEDELDRISHQVITMQYLIELAKSLKAKPDAPSLIDGFFRKIKNAEASYMKMYEEEVQAFKKRIHVRAAEKIQAAVKEQAEEDERERQNRIAASPGGLDPAEVMESLPKEMQDAFESQDVEELKKVASAMDPTEFQYHLKRCIDSGLWVADANKQNNENGEEQPAETS